MQDDCCMPLSPPPQVTPQLHPVLLGTGPQFIRQYLFLYAYILTTSDQSFWIYPIRFDDQFVYGYVWKNNAWILSKLPIDSINSVY